MSIRYLDYNLNCLYRHPEEEERFALVEHIVRDINPDVFAAQELNAEKPGEAVASIQRLAEATGLQCTINGPDGAPTHTVAKGNGRRLATGLLWHPDIEPVPHSWRVIQPEKFWHALTSLTLDVGGVSVDHACYHGRPRMGYPIETIEESRVAEAHLIAKVLSAADQNPFTVVSGDWNSMSADKLDGEYYDQPQFPADLAADSTKLASSRRAGEILLYEGGLHDVAPALHRRGTPWQPTTGHWETDKYGYRRIDIFRARAEMMRAILSYQVINTPETRAVSDHLPVVIEYNPDILLAARKS